MAELRDRARNRVHRRFTHDRRFQKLELLNLGWKIREIDLGIKGRSWPVKLIDTYYIVPKETALLSIANAKEI